jgi:hypothetical protein
LNRVSERGRKRKETMKKKERQRRSEFDKTCRGLRGAAALLLHLLRLRVPRPRSVQCRRGRRSIQNPWHSVLRPPWGLPSSSVSSLSSRSPRPRLQRRIGRRSAGTPGNRSGTTAPSTTSRTASAPTSVACSTPALRYSSTPRLPR